MSLAKHRSHLDKKLRNNLRIYVLVTIILFSILGYDIAIGIVGITAASIGIVIGVVFGFVTARMFRLSWDHDAKKIISQLDKLGIAIIILYIVLAIFRNRLIELFVHGPAVGGISIAIVTGVMIGRILGTRGRILQILKEQQLL